MNYTSHGVAAPGLPPQGGFHPQGALHPNQMAMRGQAMMQSHAPPMQTSQQSMNQPRHAPPPPHGTMPHQPHPQGPPAAAPPSAPRPQMHANAFPSPQGHPAPATSAPSFSGPARGAGPNGSGSREPVASVTSDGVTTLDTKHGDIVHDTQFDFYGHFLATASSDRTVKVFYVGAAGTSTSASPQVVATLTGHEGPVWMVSWGHPRFGTVLASASFDQRCIVWKEVSARPRQWAPIHVIDVHGGSVNAVEWAPDHFGPVLATASSDGSVAVTGCVDGVWRESVRLGANKVAHAMGASSVSFAPYSAELDGILLASGGCDHNVRLWFAPHDALHPFAQLKVLKNAHTDWVRDVAFSPSSSNTPYVLLASCGQDKRVVIYRKRWVDLVMGEDGKMDVEWERSTVSFGDACWRLSWSTMGEMLLVTTGESQVFVLKEGLNFTDPWLKVPLSEYTASQS